MYTNSYFDEINMCFNSHEAPKSLTMRNIEPYKI